MDEEESKSNKNDDTLGLEDPLDVPRNLINEHEISYNFVSRIVIYKDRLTHKRFSYFNYQFL